MMGIVWAALSILLGPDVERYSIHFHDIAIISDERNGSDSREIHVR